MFLAHALSLQQQAQVADYLRTDADKALRQMYNDLYLTLTATSSELNRFYESAGVYLSPQVSLMTMSAMGVLSPDSVGATPQEIFLRRIVAIELERGTQAAMVAIYDEIGDLFIEGDMSACDKILRQADPECMSLDLLLSLLTATATGPHDRLPNRRGFYDRVLGRFERELGPTEAKQLLDNLA